MRRSRTTLAVVAVVAVVVIAALRATSRRTALQPTVAPRDETPSDDTPRTEVDHPREVVQPEVREDGSAVASDSSAEPSRYLVVSGTVSGLDSLQASVRLSYPAWVDAVLADAPIASNGTFRMKSPYPECEGLGDGRSLTLSVLVGGGSVQAESVSLNDAREKIVSDERLLVLEASMVLQPGCIVMGALQVPTGVDAPNADVGLVDAASGAPAVLAAGTTSADGRFSLLAPMGADLTLVAVDRTADARPLSLAFRVPFARTFDVGTNALAPGLEIEGTMRLEPRIALTRNERAEVSIALSFEVAARRFGLGRHALAFVDGAAEYASRQAWLSESSTFRFRGLPALPYSLRWIGLSGGGGVLPGILCEPPVLVPPAKFEYRPESPCVLVTVKDEHGAPIPRAAVSLDSADYTFPAQASDSGQALFLCPASKRLTLTASAPGFRVRSVGLTSPECFSVALEELILWHDAVGVGEIELDLGAPGPIPVASVALTLGSEPPVARDDSRGFRIDASRIGDRFVAQQVPAGDWSMRVEVAADAATSFWLPVTTTVRVENGRRVTVTLALQEGGVVHVRVRKEDGQLLPARLELADPAGRPIEARFRQTAKSGARFEDLLRPHEDLDVSGYSEMRPSLPAGRYEFDATCPGYAERRMSVIVTAGKVSETDIVLDPE